MPRKQTVGLVGATHLSSQQGLGGIADNGKWEMGNRVNKRKDPQHHTYTCTNIHAHTYMESTRLEAQIGINDLLFLTQGKNFVLF